MTNYLNLLDEIMDSYFDRENRIKKEKLEVINEKAIKELNDSLEAVRTRRKFAIKSFNEQKEKEITEYLENISVSSNFYDGYILMKKKDLENEYAKKLKLIESKFDLEEKKIQEEIENLKNLSMEEIEQKSIFDRLDLRELAVEKERTYAYLLETEKSINKSEDRLKSKIELLDKAKEKIDSLQKEYNEVIEKISNFKYEYNEQNQIINRDEWKKLFERSNSIPVEISELANSLSENMDLDQQLQNLEVAKKKLEECFKLVELTEKEKNASLVPLTLEEIREYNIRKRLKGQSSINDDMIIDDEAVVVSEIIDEDGKIIVSTEQDLMKLLFNEIIKEVENMRGIRLNPSNGKLGQNEYYISTKDDLDREYEEYGVADLSDEEPITLPSGEYLYESDFNQAIKNLYSKNKGQVYTVSSTDKEYKINLFTILKFKRKLKACSAIKLVKDKKVSKMDITRFFGRVKAEKIFRQTNIGTAYIKNDMPEGVYINRNELIAKLHNLVSSDKLRWLRNASEKVKKYFESIEQENDNQIKKTLK